jgi:hypothetical protein
MSGTDVAGGPPLVLRLTTRARREHFLTFAPG